MMCTHQQATTQGLAQHVADQGQVRSQVSPQKADFVLQLITGTDAMIQSATNPDVAMHFAQRHTGQSPLSCGFLRSR